MDVVVSLADESQKEVLARLLEFNAYEFSAFDGRDVNERGVYGYKYLDLYWSEPDERRPFLIWCDGKLAGFALVRRGTPNTVAEFLILRKYRRRGVGLSAAAEILRTWSGEWATHQVVGNSSASAFWRRAIPYPYREQVDTSGTVQLFTVEG